MKKLTANQTKSIVGGAIVYSRPPVKGGSGPG